MDRKGHLLIKLTGKGTSEKKVLKPLSRKQLWMLLDSGMQISVGAPARGCSEKVSDGNSLPLTR